MPQRIGLLRWAGCAVLAASRQQPAWMTTLETGAVYLVIGDLGDRWDYSARRIQALPAAFAPSWLGRNAQHFSQTETGTYNVLSPGRSPCSRWRSPNRACCRALRWGYRDRDRPPPSK